MNYIQQENYDQKTLSYIKLLSKQYPNIDSASTEIINLQAILNLPKGTEHFLSDIHGEYEAFDHILRNASGVIKRKINDVFGNRLRESEKRTLATIIYYPEQKLDYILMDEKNVDDWYKITLYRLIQICKVISSKYTRSKVRKSMQSDFAYILEELLNEDGDITNKQHYYYKIIETIIKLDRGTAFIVAISKLIQRLVIDRLHVIGDIYDRGAEADKVLDTLMNYHSLDIQWGNHDIVWMGSAAGSEACICNNIRVSARYANLDIIEESYGINLLPLATFAMEHYKNDPCKHFRPKVAANKDISQKECSLIAMMHKAISIIQFKLEGQIIKRHPEYKMDGMLLLDKINFENGTIRINNKNYVLDDKNFPTIDPNNPYELTNDEKLLMGRLTSSFKNSEKLQEHARFLFSKGSIYTIYNSNLLFHACIPVDEAGNFEKVKIGDEEYSGKEFFDHAERIARSGYFNTTCIEEKREGMDFIWYLWCGPASPLFGKSKMATFERYFLTDKETHVEENNGYFELRNNENFCKKILGEFGLTSKDSHIINGHVPVKVVKGENPIKANGKLIVIDGGISKAYQAVTGIAGYTLIYNSYGLMLTTHEPFESTQKAIEEETDILSTSVAFEQVFVRKKVEDTDAGDEIKNQIEDLVILLKAYRSGIIKEQK